MNSASILHLDSDPESVVFPYFWLFSSLRRKIFESGNAFHCSALLSKVLFHCFFVLHLQQGRSTVSFLSSSGCRLFQSVLHISAPPFFRYVILFTSRTVTGVLRYMAFPPSPFVLCHRFCRIKRPIRFSFSFVSFFLISLSPKANASNIPSCAIPHFHFRLSHYRHTSFFPVNRSSV